MSDTYTINCWECDGENPATEQYEDAGWKPAFTGLTKWQLRNKLREVYAWGWTPISVQVIAETHQRPAKRWERGYDAMPSIPARTFTWMKKHMRAA